MGQSDAEALKELGCSSSNRFSYDIGTAIVLLEQDLNWFLSRDVTWERRRYETARDIMIAKDCSAAYAVEKADELIEKLKERKNSND